MPLEKNEHLDLSMSVYDDCKADGLVVEGIIFMILVWEIDATVMLVRDCLADVFDGPVEFK